jgi:hypothetical protein
MRASPQQSQVSFTLMRSLLPGPMAVVESALDAVRNALHIRFMVRATEG